MMEWFLHGYEETSFGVKPIPVKQDTICFCIHKHSAHYSLLFFYFSTFHEVPTTHVKKTRMQCCGEPEDNTETLDSLEKG